MSARESKKSEILDSSAGDSGAEMGVGGLEKALMSMVSSASCSSASER